MIGHTAKRVASYALTGRIDVVARELRCRAYLDTVFIGLRRDVSVPLAPPRAKVNVDVRPLASHERDVFRAAADSASSALDRDELLERDSILRAGLGTCYVAVDEKDRVLYAQWLVFPAENEGIIDQFHGRLPQLDADEALLEAAITLPESRGLGVMPHAMARIAEQARGTPARWVITFVRDTNTASLKGCQRAGFGPYIERREQWRAYRRRFVNAPLS